MVGRPSVHRYRILVTITEEKDLSVVKKINDFLERVGYIFTIFLSFSGQERDQDASRF